MKPSSSLKCGQCGLVNFATAESCKRCGNALISRFSIERRQENVIVDPKVQVERVSEQLKMVTLRCPNCGGALEINGDMERFACAYCGSEQIVERRGGTVALRLADAVARVQVGTDKTAAELALVRLDKEITALKMEWDAASATLTARFVNGKSSTTQNQFVAACVFCMIAAIGTLVALAAVKFLLFVLWAAILGVAIAALVFTKKRKAEAVKQFEVDRANLWFPYANRLRDLDLQVAKNRNLVSEW